MPPSSVGGTTPCDQVFWPPPESTSIWTSTEDALTTFGDAANRIDAVLGVAGYTDMHPIPRLPEAGRYRVLLVAFTDLPVTSGGPKRRDEETWMEGQGANGWRLPLGRRVGSGYRVAVYVYEYRSTGGDGDGELVIGDDEKDAVATLREAGLTGLARVGGARRPEVRGLAVLSHHRSGEIALLPHIFTSSDSKSFFGR